MTLSAILGCENKNNERPRDDFFETPAASTQALIDAEKNFLPDVIWEPFCGNGAISRVLRSNGIGVIETDLNETRLSGEHRIDFLFEYKACESAIVTNPPFKLARQIIYHAKFIGIRYMALLLKADFLNCQRSLKLFNHWRPARIHGLTIRPDFRNQGSPTMNCSWYVWDGDEVKNTFFDLLDG